MTDEHMDEDPFEAALEASFAGLDMAQIEADLAAGEAKLYRGTVAGVTGKDVFVELGPRLQGVLSVNEFAEPPGAGESIEVAVVNIEDDLLTLARRPGRNVGAPTADVDLEPGDIVTAKVVGQNKGGLELKAVDVDAFMPVSHIDLGRVEDMGPYMGQTMSCEVIEVDASRGRVVLSRRAVLAREKEEGVKRMVSALMPNQVIRGRVTRLESFGAFVDVGGGVEGLLHISNMSRTRISSPDEKVSEGQEVEVMILEISQDGRRIGLGMKQLEANPWNDFAVNHRVDDILTGKVTRTAKFGAFVEVVEGVEGLLHVSQMATERVNRVGDHVKVGEEITVRIQSIDVGEERLSLSKLTSRGQLIGSDEEAEDGLVDDIVRGDGGARGGTNLGDLLRKALDRDDE